ncbi:malonyl-CoA decarboxylase [Terrarubrum flagellatum]|uniref:malonyl-CoA decarboxylase n=1 Tax=Terrirubrum flagellatum TaxID=2895980 RepID=UPI0031452D5D
MSSSFFTELITTISDRGRSLLPRQWIAGNGGAPDLAALCLALISGRGEASGVAIAREILSRWDKLDGEGRKAFLLRLAEDFGPDVNQLEAAIAAWRDHPGQAALANIHAAAEAKRQEVIRRLNQAPGGTRKLVQMREELFAHQDAHPVLNVLDKDFVHLFSSWFNRGFLVLRRIDWSSSAALLEKIIRYEAVHAIGDWEELRRRIEPEDRRLFAFFHPQMIDEPLIFVEVALTRAIPEAIAPVLAADRTLVRASEATTAVFYSISNCQEGLRGVSFGNFLIKQVVEDLRRELPNLTTFVTLSPAPSFAGWLKKQRAGAPDHLSTSDQQTLALLDDADWSTDAEKTATLKPVIERAAAAYFIRAKTPRDRPIDPVARFHLGNGARLERLDMLGDRSPKGIKQSHGLMVNYLYDLKQIEANHEAYAEKGEVIASREVRRHLRGESRPAEAQPATAARQ